MTEKPIVGVVLINYHNYAQKYLAECYESLKQLNYPQEKLKIIVVDNDPIPESRAFLQEFNEIIVVEQKDGNYCAGNNVGIKKAEEEGCEYIAILNMDVVVDKDWLVKLLEPFEHIPRIGIVQSKILLHQSVTPETSENLINTTGNKLNFLAFGYTENYRLSEDKYQPSENFPEIGYASGCSFLIKTNLMKEIGRYDEELYMYHDDLDLSLRVKARNYKLVLAPKSIVYHKYEFKRSVRMIYYIERNRLITYLVMMPRIQLWLTLPIFFLFELGMFAYSLKNKWHKEKIKIYTYFFNKQNFLNILNKRRFFHQHRDISSRQLIDNWQGGIYFLEIDNPLLKYIINPLLEIYWKIIKLITVW